MLEESATEVLYDVDVLQLQRYTGMRAHHCGGFQQ